MKFEGIILSEISQRKEDTVWYQLYMEPKNIKFIEQSRVVVTRGRGGGGGRNGEVFVKG